MLKKIEAVIRPGKFAELRDALDKCHIKGMTVSQVMGCGHQKGYTEYYRGAAVEINLLHKILLEIVVKDDQVEEIIKLLSSVAQTGKVGDGKIFIYDVENVYRIRTGEQGETAL